MNKLILRSILIIAAVSMISVGSTSAYFSDTKVISGNVFSTGTWTTIVINEVNYLGDKEWIELYNAGNSTVDIKGWAICNSADDCGKLNPEKKTEVPAKGFVILSHDQNDLKDWDVAKEIVNINYAGGKIHFKDDGDSVVLKNTENSEIDQMSYGTNTTAFDPSCPTVIVGHSLQRDPASTDTDKATDFKDQSTPTPGY